VFLFGYNTDMRSTLLFLVASLLPGFCLGSDLDAEIFAGINSIRTSRGLCALEWEPRLAAAARSQSLWMAEVGRMDHLREPARSFEEFLVCDYHPSNRVVKSGYFAFEDLYRAERGDKGATVYPLPAANDKVGEIIAKGWGGEGAYDVRRVLVGWMNSPGHREEILKGDYRDAGVAVCSPRPGETYWCVVFAYR
jgi:uncharacterized protein YkwD